MDNCHSKIGPHVCLLSTLLSEPLVFHLTFAPGNSPYPEPSEKMKNSKLNNDVSRTLHDAPVLPYATTQSIHAVPDITSLPARTTQWRAQSLFDHHNKPEFLHSFSHLPIPLTKQHCSCAFSTCPTSRAIFPSQAELYSFSASFPLVQDSCIFRSELTDKPIHAILKSREWDPSSPLK